MTSTTWRNTSRFSPAVPETSHDGHAVTIIRPLTADEADLPDTGPMYRVRCTIDSTVFDAFTDELDPCPDPAPSDQETRS